MSDNLLKKFWDKEESLTIFLWLLLIFIFLITPLTQLFPGLRILIDFSFGLALISGIGATVESPQLSTAASILVVAAVGASLGAILSNGHPWMTMISHFSDIPALGLFLYIIIKQTLRAGPITPHRVKGAIASYLLLALTWAKAYTLIHELIPNSFSGLNGGDSFISLMYFSFVTLTSVGYGDILPTHALSRSLSNAESLIGQLFPAIFIARLVSLEIEQRRR